MGWTRKKSRLAASLLLIIIPYLLSPPGVSSEPFRFSPRPNRAHLIKWRHWGREALKEAKTKDRPILLSLSAVWCHWCHVMDETTYSDQRVIDFINQNYIPIRVDADMRPDIDRIYNQGGWPSTVLLTPEGEILNGGTYIPPDKMLQMLSDTLNFYKHNKSKIKKRLIELSQREKSTHSEDYKEEQDYEIIENIKRSIEEGFDDRYGGFDIGQKFPRPEVLEFLLTYYRAKRKSNIERMITQTLDAMAISMLYDHEEGGFFRYSVKRDWSEPHYEKMLDTNSALLKVYAEAYSLFKKDLYLRTAKGIYDYLIKNLYDKDTGLFYGSQDADESYYQSRNRASLKPPPIDRTIYADRNALTLSALLRYATLTENTEALRTAKRLANSIIKHLYKRDRGVFHYLDSQKNPRLPGLLMDNVLFGLSLLDAYEVTADKRFLNLSKEIATLLVKKHFIKGLLRDSRPSLVNPVTSGMLKEYSLLRSNYYGLLLFSRLQHYTPSYKETLSTLIKELSKTYENLYFTSSIFARSLLIRSTPVYDIEIIATAESIKPFLQGINAIYLPFKRLRVYLLNHDETSIKKRGLPPKEGLYICRGKRCFKPISPAMDIAEKLKRIIK